MSGLVNSVRNIHVPPFSLRLLKLNNNRSVEDSEDSKEKSEDKEYCSDSNKEVGACVCVCVAFLNYGNRRETKD